MAVLDDKFLETLGLLNLKVDALSLAIFLMGNPLHLFLVVLDLKLFAMSLLIGFR